MLLLKSGIVFVCGDNSNRQINLDPSDPYYNFTIIPQLFDIRKIKCSSFLSAQNYDRELFIFGNTYFLSPFLVETGNGLWKIQNFNLILDYSIGNNFIILNDIKAGIFSCGVNHKGQLGRNKENENEFGVVTQLIDVKIKDIKCGYDFVVCEMGVKPLHPRDEMLLANLEMGQQTIGNEEFPPNFNVQGRSHNAQKWTTTNSLKTSTKITSTKETSHQTSETPQIQMPKTTPTAKTGQSTRETQVSSSNPKMAQMTHISIVIFLVNLISI